MKKSIEPAASYDTLSEARQSRTFKSMTALDSTVAKEIFPETHQDAIDKRVAAAIVIQSHYRGYVDRGKFLGMLYDQFEKEEEDRKARAARQVEEGELLVANHKLEIEFEDAETAVKNKEKLYQFHIITIQRAWRAYKRRQLKKLHSLTDASCEEVNEDARGKDVEADTSCEGVKVDASGEGVESDTSCEGAKANPECRRKNLLLNKAQEFADLKRQFDDVLPFNAHKATPLTDSSYGSSLSSSSDNSPSAESRSITSNVNASNKESEITLPQLEWTELERSINHSHSSSLRSSSNSKSVKDAHREDVRKRLAMNTPTEGLYGDAYTRSQSKPYRAYNNAMELYMNDCNDEAASCAAGGDNSETDLATKQQRLHDQATIAYIQAGPIAKKLIEVEKKSEEPSQIARMLGISTFRSQGEMTLNKKRLESLSLAQLQVVYNAMQNEIERLNEELMEIAVARDELHMQQDSILVNIEDLEKRIEQLSHKRERKVQQKASKKTTAEEPATKSTSRMSRLFRLGRNS
ncbi:IQCJ-SCHIP1 readthrough transcript protein-like isoform X2 [Watersipora subatra]|uniref:IQCJ-SCHIP1 readthrough transcript protein-like isoform X2 n=1 Tax=Watersipora subatra TaxID=2589382 RepID=UPI00355AE199